MDWMEEHGIDSKEALKVMKNASVKTDLQEVESSNTQSNEVKDVKAEEKKVLVLDIDGTLTNSKKEITENNKKALKKFQAAGIMK